MTIEPTLAGALAGCAATAPMTAAMELLHRALPQHERYPLPPSQITSSVAGKLGVADEIGGDEHTALTLLAHFGYGAAAGALYGQVAQRATAAPAISGMLYGLGVWGVSYLGLLPAMNILPPATRHPGRRNALMIASHLVWGASLGLLAARLAEPKRA